MRFLTLIVFIALLVPATASAATAPGAPGGKALWTEADKDGYGTATGTRSKVWHTLDDGELTEVYYPDLDTPAFRDLQFVVSDGRTFAEREREDAQHAISLADKRSLTYRQVNTTSRYKLVKTYVTDPARNALLVDVKFTSRTGKKLDLYALADPALSNNGDDDSGAGAGSALVASDADAASALVAEPAFTKTSSGYLGTSDGWQDLRSDFRMDWAYDAAPKWLSDRAAYRAAAELFYFWTHLPATVGVLVWVWLERRPAFRPARNAFMLTQLATLAINALLPTTPPSMSPAEATRAAEGGQLVYALQSPFAAMPSGHVAFAVFTAGTLLALVRSRAIRLAAVAYVALVVAVVIATGNHFWLDAAAGAAIAAIAAIAMRATS